LTQPLEEGEGHFWWEECDLATNPGIAIQYCGGCSLFALDGDMIGCDYQKGGMLR